MLVWAMAADPTKAAAIRTANNLFICDLPLLGRSAVPARRCRPGPEGRLRTCAGDHARLLTVARRPDDISGRPNRQMGGLTEGTRPVARGAQVGPAHVAGLPTSWLTSSWSLS